MGGKGLAGRLGRRGPKTLRRSKRRPYQSCCPWCHLEFQPYFAAVAGIGLLITSWELLIFLFLSLALLVSCRSSRARDQTFTAVEACSTAVATPDP